MAGELNQPWQNQTTQNQTNQNQWWSGQQQGATGGNMYGQHAVQQPARTQPPTSGYGSFSVPTQPTPQPTQQAAQVPATTQPQGPMQKSSYAGNPLWQQNAAGTGYEPNSFNEPFSLAGGLVNSQNWFSDLGPSSAPGDIAFQKNLMMQSAQQRAKLLAVLQNQLPGQYGGDKQAMLDAYQNMAGQLPGQRDITTTAYGFGSNFGNNIETTSPYSGGQEQYDYLADLILGF